MSMLKDFTPPQIVKMAQVGHDTVFAWIHSGELEAYNVADPLKLRPRFRVTLDARQSFKERRLHPPAALRRARLKHCRG
jgi:hypothetical protein